MKKAARNSFYALISIVAVTVLVALLVFERIMNVQLGQTYSGVYLLHATKILTPVIVAALFFIKIYMQRSVSAKFSFIVNVIALILLLVGLIAFHSVIYPVPGLLGFALTSPLSLFAIGLQTFSLLCDMASKKRGAPGEALPVPPVPTPAPAPPPALAPESAPEETPTSL